MKKNVFGDGILSAYIGLFFVVIVWGCSPVITQELYKYYSPTFRVFFAEVILLISYIILGRKHIKEFNMDYIKVGIPTGFFLALANISQKIGLMYTTPAKYAFLENLSCISVPILMYILVKKKPGKMTIVSCFLALLSVFILNGISFDDASTWGIGEILCAVSGLLYGFNIAGTGAYAKKLNAPLYLATQSVISAIISLIFALVLNFTTYTNVEGVQVPIEKIVFSINPGLIAFTTIYIVVGSALCWIIRTNSMKKIDASIVTIIMPFSAVITGVISVLTGKDAFSANLVFGGLIGVLAIFLSSYDDIFKRKNQ